jgi:hypothetical protein
MELGIPLTTMADSMQSAGVMQGMHTIDVGILVTPVIVEMLAYIGDDAGIDYELGIEQRIDEDKVSDTKIALALKKMRKELPAALEEKEEETMPMDADETEPRPSGLMARRS